MKKALWVIIPVLLLVLLLPTALGISIGVSPGLISIDNLLRDGYAEKIVTISSSISEEVNAHFEVDGEVKDWLTFEPANPNFKISKEKPYILRIIVQPPSDAPMRIHTGEISFITDSVASVEGGIGSSVRAAIMSRIELKITDKQIVQCRGGGLSFLDTEIGMPLVFQANVINDGNVRLEPVFDIEIWDQARKNIVYVNTITGKSVSPTTQDTFEIKLPNDLSIGQYWVNMVLRTADTNERGCWISDFSTFSVYEKGAIIDRGILENVSTKVWATVGEIVEVVAVFRNAGERSVDAKFTGTVTNEDRIVNLLESETLRVAPGEVARLTTYFTPQTEGRYMVTGKVLYNNKLTFEKGSVVNVTTAKPAKASLSRWIPILLYILIFLTIIYLLYRIRKARNRYKGYK
jgi:hypothetical protein